MANTSPTTAITAAVLFFLLSGGRIGFASRAEVGLELSDEVEKSEDRIGFTLRDGGEGGEQVALAPSPAQAMVRLCRRDWGPHRLACTGKLGSP